MPPFMTEKREPVSLVATSKSRPSAAPTSTWSFTSKSNAGGVPTLRTSTLPVSSVPTGTDACGRFGTDSMKAASLACTSASAVSLALSSSPRPPTSAITAVVSSPLPFIMPICLDSELRLPCSSSVRVWIALRSASRALKPATSSWNLRVARRAATLSMSLRRSWMSIIGRDWRNVAKPQLYQADRHFLRVSRCRNQRPARYCDLINSVRLFRRRSGACL